MGGITLFNFVANYGSFRSSIDYIVSDAKAFSSYVIEHFVENERHFTGVMRDISEHVQIMKALEQTRNEAEQPAHHRTIADANREGGASLQNAHDQIANDFRWILQIGIHDDKTLTPRNRHPAQHGVILSTIHFVMNDGAGNTDLP